MADQLKILYVDKRYVNLKGAVYKRSATIDPLNGYGIDALTDEPIRVVWNEKRKRYEEIDS